MDILWVGAAPGNAGARGSGRLGAHGTRIPFGGDVAGANLDVLLGSIGLDRNETYIVAAMNRLPETGGGEPSRRELAESVGEYASSVDLLRDTVVAAGPRLIIALGNVALRTIAAAFLLSTGYDVTRRGALPTLYRLRSAGLKRGVLADWPAEEPSAHDFADAWTTAWPDAEVPSLLWLTHPSAQNMSPYAGTETVFHRRMIRARDGLREATRELFGGSHPEERPAPPSRGIYALSEWVEDIGPRHEELDRLWRAKGV